MSKPKTAEVMKIPPLMRLKEVLTVFPISASGWYEGQRCGRFPKPIFPMGKKIALYRGEEIAALVNRCLDPANDNAGSAADGH